MLDIPVFFTPELLEQLGVLMHEAEELAKGDDRASARVAFIRDGLDLTEHYVAAANHLLDFFHTKDYAALGDGLYEAGEVTRVTARTKDLNTFSTGAVLQYMAQLSAGIYQPLNSINPGAFAYSDSFRDWGAKLALQALDYGGFEPRGDGLVIEKGGKAWLEYEFVAQSGYFPGSVFDSLEVAIADGHPSLTAAFSCDSGKTYVPLMPRRKPVSKDVVYHWPDTFLDVSGLAKGHTRVRVRLMAEGASKDANGDFMYFMRSLRVNGRIVRGELGPQ